jgi:hypothetical protein
VLNSRRPGLVDGLGWGGQVDVESVPLVSIGVGEAAPVKEALVIWGVGDLSASGDRRVDEVVDVLPAVEGLRRALIGDAPPANQLTTLNTLLRRVLTHIEHDHGSGRAAEGTRSDRAPA